MHDLNIFDTNETYFHDIDDVRAFLAGLMEFANSPDNQELMDEELKANFSLFISGEKPLQIGGKPYYLSDIKALLFDEDTCDERVF
jgi:hypothetical protein